MIYSKQLFKKAIKTAEKSNVIRGKIGAVAFLSNGNILASAHNSSFLGSLRIRTVHAEQALLNKLDKISAFNRYVDIKILVIRWRKGVKVLANAKPCNDCEKRLKMYPVKVYYTNEDGIIEELE